MRLLTPVLHSHIPGPALTHPQSQYQTCTRSPPVLRTLTPNSALAQPPVPRTITYPQSRTALRPGATTAGSHAARCVTSEVQTFAALPPRLCSPACSVAASGWTARGCSVRERGSPPCGWRRRTHSRRPEQGLRPEAITDNTGLCTLLALAHPAQASGLPAVPTAGVPPPLQGAGAAGQGVRLASPGCCGMCQVSSAPALPPRRVSCRWKTVSTGD